MSAGTSRRWSPWLLSVTVVVWALLLIRAVPGVLWDRGVFVSTAERLLAGDRLYAEVWDNKDPLFYYTLALGRTVSPLMDVVLEYGWLAAACAGVLLLARWLHCDTATSVLAGLIVAPVILTGAFYLPGHTHLPGTAVVLLALAATAHRRYVWAGALLGIVFFLKVLYIPLAVAMLAVVVIRRRAWRAAAFIAGGFALTAGLITAVLQIRGELGPYLNMLRANVTYTQGPLTGSVLDVSGHLDRVMSPGAISVVVTVTVILLLDRTLGREAASPLWAPTVAALVSALLTLAVTGLWWHHAQILYVPAVLAGLIGVMRLGPQLDPRRPRTIAIAVLVAVLLAGASTPLTNPSVTAARATVRTLTAVPPETAGLQTLAATGSYARVGQNDDAGHAFGLRDRELMCPRFHQYPFESAEILDQTLLCLPRADVIVVSPMATPLPDAPDWNRFIEQVERILAEGYSCQPWNGERICTARTPMG